MNKVTLEKLKKNPHYKLSEEQKREAREEEIERKGMVAIGKLDKNPTGMERQK